MQLQKIPETSAEKLAVIKKIQKKVAKGETVVNACNDLGITWSNFYVWRRKLDSNYASPTRQKKRKPYKKRTSKPVIAAPLTIEVPDPVQTMCVIFGPVDKITEALKTIGAN